MLPKPLACRGCPLYGNGMGYVPDEWVPGAAIAIVAQNPGEDEERGQRLASLPSEPERYESHPPAPLIGKTGRLVMRNLMPLLGRVRGEVSLANAIRCRWQRHGTPVNDLPPAQTILAREALAHCQRAHWRPPPGTRTYLALGEYAAFALTGCRVNIANWRGFVLPYRPLPLAPLPQPPDVWTPTPEIPVVLVSYHPAFLFRDPAAKIPIAADWKRLAALARGAWPSPLPSIIPWAPSGGWPSAPVAFDTEYTAERRLLRYSMAWRAPRGTVVHVVEAAQHVDAIATWPAPPHVVMHNAATDLPFLEALWPTMPKPVVDDTMLMHAVLWPGKVAGEDEGVSGLAHTLRMLGSLYGSANAWKHLAETNPVVYSAADAVVTLDVFEALTRELEHDPPSWRVYHEQVRLLLPILARAHRHGLRVDTARVERVLGELSELQTEQTLRAQAEAGWPLSLRSPQQVSHELYSVQHVHSRVRGIS